MANARYTCFKGAWITVDARRQDGRGFIVDDETLIMDLLEWQRETRRYPVFTAESGVGRWIGFVLEDDLPATEKWLNERIYARANET